MGGKFLVFVMLYLMVDISLVLGFELEFQAGHKFCKWQNVDGNSAELNCVEEGKADKKCTYNFGNINPNTCQYFVQHEEKYFEGLAIATKTRTLSNVRDHGGVTCITGQSVNNPHHCTTVHYVATAAAASPSDDLVWEY